MNSGFDGLGAEVRPGGVAFRTWAPQALEVGVKIMATGSVRRAIPLQGDETGMFTGFDEQGRSGDLYRFCLDGGAGCPDPLSRFQPERVHGPSMVIDPSSYPWQDQHWKKPAVRDLVIYELHVGTFSLGGSFLSAIEKLQHLKDLGVNAIELMPVAEFAGGRNWGYDGVCWYAPSRVYGHPDDLRRLVDAAHQAGLAVILDVVYNHLGPDGNYLSSFIGDYFDKTAKTPWGGAIMYGAPQFRALRDIVICNPAYWMREFHIDGFRLDATHAIVDHSPRHILQELTESIHALGGIAIAEDPRNECRMATPVDQDGMGFDAVWADDFHHVVRVMNTHEDEGYLSDFKGSTAEMVAVLQNGWLYCGQDSRFEGKPRGTSCSHLAPQGFVHCISNHDQTGNHAFGERLAHRVHPVALRAADALLCLTPYTPMIFMGQEWSASSPFLFFTDHGQELGDLIIAGRREEFRHFVAFHDPALLTMLPNPQTEDSFLASKLIWEEARRPRHAFTLALYKACLALRKGTPTFRPPDRASWRVKALSWGAGLLMFEGMAESWAVVFDLEGGHQGELSEEKDFRPASGEWHLVLSTNESRFGGTGKSGISLPSLSAAFVGPETLVLHRKAKR